MSSVIKSARPDTADARSPCFSRIEKDNLSDLAYRQIRRALMQSELKPGERLRLRPLSAKLGISATPVREALIRLVSENALCFDSRGTAIVPFLDLSQLLEIRDLRVELEGNAGSRAARIATSNDIRELEDIHNEIEESHRVEDFHRALLLNEQFHFRVASIPKRPVTYQILETLWMRCGPLLSHLYDKGNLPWKVHPHTLVIEGLRSRDSDKVRAAIKDDIIEGGQRLVELVNPHAS